MQAHVDKLEAVREAVDSWRRSKARKSEPMPDHLWREAAGLLAWFTAARVSVTLRLNLNKLKKEFAKLGQEPALIPPKPTAEERTKAEAVATDDHQTIEVTRVDLVKDESCSPVEPIRISVNKFGMQIDLTLPAGHDPSLISSLMNHLLQGVSL